MYEIRTKVFKGDAEKYGVQLADGAEMYEPNMELGVERRIVQLENEITDEESFDLSWETTVEILQAEGYEIE